MRSRVPETPSSVDYYLESTRSKRPGLGRALFWLACTYAAANVAWAVVRSAFMGS